MSSARSDAEAEEGAWAAAQAAAEAVLGGDDGDDAAQEDQTMDSQENKEEEGRDSHMQAEGSDHLAQNNERMQAEGSGWMAEPDPFDVDAYKILHFPGHAQCRGRNLVRILDDRSVGGPRFRNARFLRGAAEDGGDGDGARNSPGSDRHLDVPSTPVNGGASSPTTPMNTEDADDKYHSPPARQVCPRTPTQPHHFHTPSNASPAADLASVNAPAATPLDDHVPSPIDVSSEITAFGEYAAATKFQAGYLKHLGGGSGGGGSQPRPEERLTREQRETNRQLQQHLRQHNLPARLGRGARPMRRPASDGSGTVQGGAGRGPWAPPPHRQQQRQWGGPPPPPRRAAIPSPAVSTISIAVSPDGRTLASTHGDHTVKVTCCHTGKLLRNLEGHPRTPWTVKFHPSNPKIVASGCLGYQVRVWDWNFQKEAARKVRRMERERRWRGRYDFGEGERGNAAGSPPYRAKSPRAVVEHPWRKTLAEADDEGGASCANTARSNGGLPAQMQLDAEDDDYAALALAEAGIPPDDPAWCDPQNDPYNSEDGIGVCLRMIRLHSAIISLSFHPSGEILAMASGSTLHLWDYNEEARKCKRKAEAAARDNGIQPAAPARESDSRILDRSQEGSFPAGQTIDFKHESALRCVHFPPDGATVIVGGVNPAGANEGLPNRGAGRNARGGMSGGGMSFHLRLWDFDLDAVVNPSARDLASGGAANRGGEVSDDGELRWNYPVLKESLSNARTIIPRVLLYNDGGFDLSHDGKVLSACADFWLPEDVDSVTELLEMEQKMGEEEEKKQQLDSFVSEGTPTRSPASRMGSNVSSPPPRSQHSFADPRTPPPNFSMASLEPPSPPGKRNVSHIPGGPSRVQHNPHPLSVVAPSHPVHQGEGGRYVPHIVAVSLDTSPPPNGELTPLDPKVVRTESMRRHPELGRLLVAAPLDGAKSSGVTCVKLSPTGEYCLLGYGVRESIPSVHDGEPTRHPVTSLYNVKKGMKHVCTLTCEDDDVNIARFHPESGHGFVYGTKQGRVRVMACRPWNYYEAVDED